MLEFIQLLSQKYQNISANLAKNDSRYALFKKREEQLILADAFIRKGLLLKSHPQTPLQIAIIGPTQTGKSTITNLILNSDDAKVSPLAGYTIHSQGFCHKATLENCLGLQSFYGRFQQLSQSELTNTRFDCYSLTDNQQTSLLLPECVFWDTADFDAIGSADYKEGLTRAIALADIIILAISKEKYADQSVWEMMATIALLRQPTLICINKLIGDNEDVIIRSLKEKWRQVRTDDFPAVVPLHYQPKTGMPVWTLGNKPLLQLRDKVDYKKHFANEQLLLDKYWHGWLEPVIAEHNAIKTWHAMVEQNIEQIVQEYQCDFLNHPQHYNTFQKAIIALLNLLEIPGISGVLTSTRRVLTWPLRKVMGIGKAPKSALSQEITILNQLGNHFVTLLTAQLREKIDQSDNENKWWNDCYDLLRQQSSTILDYYQHCVVKYDNDFQQDIEAIANRLYDKLSGRPIILNSLRATRVSIDTAAMASIVATGGINALVITPVMLSITSMLTEGAIGGYMKGVEVQLRQNQMGRVKRDLFIACLQQSLYKLPKLFTTKRYFNMSSEQIKKAENQRKLIKT